MKLVMLIATFFSTILSISSQNSAIKAGLSMLYSNGYEKSLTSFGGGAMLEYKIANKFTICASFDYLGAERTATAILVSGDRISIPYQAPTVSLRPEFRFYPKAAMNGFFTGIGFQLNSSKVGEIVTSANPAEPYIVSKSDDFSAYPTLLVGLSLPIRSNLSVEFSGGLGVLIEDPAYFALPFQMRVGYSF